MNFHTIFSPDRRYRYVLWREWAPLTDRRYVQFIGLNPSTATETEDDPTVRRCINFSKAWGYGALCMTNLFAFRATNPRVMMGCGTPIGPENDGWLARCARDADLVVAAWGNHGRYIGRDEEVIKLLGIMHCLGVTKEGCPKHPLYLKGDSVPESFAA